MEIVTTVCLILIVQSCSVYGDRKDEAEALLVFKRSLSRGVNTLSTWKVSSPEAPCDWAHINCDHEGYVSAIYLGGVGIGGHIEGTPLTKLPRLVHLDLSGNTIGGTIPDDFQHISFTRLVLNNNQINGTIPCSLGSIHEILYTIYFFEGNVDLHGFCDTCFMGEKPGVDDCC